MAKTDTEKLVTAMKNLDVDIPFGRITFRAIDHQSTMGAYVGRTAVKEGVPQEEADQIKAQLEEAGATVEVK